MERLSVGEASAFDLLEALDDEGRPSRFTRYRFGLMARQVNEGWSLTIREPEAGQLVAVVGLWPEADHAEAWLAVGPAFRRNLRRALEQMALALEGVMTAAGVPEARVYVRPGDRVAGARMARWLGFTETGPEASPAGPVVRFTKTFGAGTPT